MPIVNACLGGLANAIPSGQAKLNLTWITNDGENQQVTFVISGTASKSVQSDANGYASVQLPVGTYTVSITHGGEYLGDDPKTITLASRETGTLTWLTGARQSQQVTITSPGPLKASSVSYTIGLGSTTVQSGSIWNATMTFNLFPGSYKLTLTAYGDTITRDFEVPKTSGLTLDLANQFCMLTVSDSKSYGTKNITVRGYTCTATTTYSTNHTFYVLRSSKSASIGGTVNTPTPPKYSGIATKNVYDFSVSAPTVTPDSANKSVVFQVSVVPSLTILTSGGTLGVPAGNYEVLINGGGGARLSDSFSYYSANRTPFGGEIKRYEGSLEGDYSITLGAGGKSGSGSTLSGSASSFGTILSANGGSGGRSDWDKGIGVGGGERGEGVGSWDTESSGIANKARDSTGDVGGGGGGGGGYAAGKGNNSGYGQTGGSKCSVFGGNGGRGGKAETHSSSSDIHDPGADGSPGTEFMGYTSLGGGGGEGGYGSFSVNSSRYYSVAGGGGGGGGGYGANGGNGGPAFAKSDNSIRLAGAGGGAGGAYGGDGGDGGSTIYSDSSSSFVRTHGSHGKGYGAGAGGMTGYISSSSSVQLMNGGGGGGGIGSSYVKSESSPDGAPGCVLIRWLS